MARKKLPTDINATLGILFDEGGTDFFKVYRDSGVIVDTGIRPQLQEIHDKTKTMTLSELRDFLVEKYPVAFPKRRYKSRSFETLVKNLDFIFGDRVKNLQSINILLDNLNKENILEYQKVLFRTSNDSIASIRRGLGKADIRKIAEAVKAIETKPTHVKDFKDENKVIISYAIRRDSFSGEEEIHPLGDAVPAQFNELIRPAYGELLGLKYRSEGAVLESNYAPKVFDLGIMTDLEKISKNMRGQMDIFFNLFYDRLSYSYKKLLRRRMKRSGQQFTAFFSIVLESNSEADIKARLLRIFQDASFSFAGGQADSLIIPVKAFTEEQQELLDSDSAVSKKGKFYNIPRVSANSTYKEMLGIEDYKDYEEFNDEPVIRTVPLRTGDEGIDSQYDDYRDLNLELDDYLLLFMEQGFDETDLVESDSEQTIESTFGAMINLCKTQGSFVTKFNSLQSKAKQGEMDLDDAEKFTNDIAKTAMAIRKDFVKALTEEFISEVSNPKSSLYTKANEDLLAYLVKEELIEKV